MKKDIYFDNSLAAFVQILNAELGEEVFKNNIFLRDVKGRIAFLLRDTILSSEIERVNIIVGSVLGNYVEEGFAVCNVTNLFDEELENLELNDNHKRKVFFDLESSVVINYIERRVVGGDWQRYFPENNGPARLVFSSIKGGVGRTTALCVIAASLAKSGKRVLAIDLDLEAPGLGNMLLTPETVPDFGLIDYFVETNLNNFESKNTDLLIGPSWLSDGKGRIDVIPAVGKHSLDNPSDVLSKLSRAYLSKTTEDGVQLSFMDNLRALLDEFSFRRYDVILIDSRAGLHETTASALVGLGADVFCFGVDQLQTLQGYELLFSAIASNKNTLTNGINWAQKLHFVHAKAPLESEKRKSFSDKIESLCSKFFDTEKSERKIDSNILELKDSFDVDWNENINLEDFDLLNSDFEFNEVLTVLDDKTYSEFDPLRNRDTLLDKVYNITFGSLLRKAESLVEEAREHKYEKD